MDWGLGFLLFLGLFVYGVQQARKSTGGKVLENTLLNYWLGGGKK